LSNGLLQQHEVVEVKDAVAAVSVEGRENLVEPLEVAETVSQEDEEEARTEGQEGEVGLVVVPAVVVAAHKQLTLPTRTLSLHLVDDRRDVLTRLSKRSMRI